jgi:hypothetical protein
MVGEARRLLNTRYGEQGERLPKTPEGWVEFQELFVAVAREEGFCDPDWRDPTFDNWRLWVEYQWRKSPRPVTHGMQRVALCLPKHIGKDGKPNIATLALAANLSTTTVRKALAALTVLGADFTRLRDQPHPTRTAESPPV